jgi:MFS family permease
MTRVSTRLLGSAAVAALGGFLFGFDTAVISGATDALRLRFGLGSNQLGFTVASALIGTIFGSIGAASRPNAWPAAGARCARGALPRDRPGCGLAWNWFSLVVFRFIGGLAIGASSVVAPMYIAEISPAPMRGRLVALSQFNVVAGILAPTFRTT